MPFPGGASVEVQDSSSEGAELRAPFANARGRLTVTVGDVGQNERYNGPHELVYLTSDRIRGQYPNVVERAHIHNVIEGIANLTDLVTQYEIDTLLFLDKSARPMAYLFRKTWAGVFPNDRTPDIRFIDVGQGSYEPAKLASPDALAEVKNRYAECVVGKRVLVVDEYTESGSSLLAAKKLIEGLFPDAEKVYATAVSPTTPKWYGKREMIGVANSHEYLEEYALFTDPVVAEKPSFISSTLFGALNKASLSEEGIRLRDMEMLETIRSSNVLREELDGLAEELTRCFGRLPAGSFKVTPYIPDSISNKNLELTQQ